MDKSCEIIKMGCLKSLRHPKYVAFKLGLACATQDVDQLVTHDLLDVGTSGLQVLTGIEVIGMLVEVLTDGTGHSKTQVGVDVEDRKSVV